MADRDRPLVRASEIGLWAYCHRAWWLASMQGAVHQNPQRLTRGAEQHAFHGEQTLQAQRIQRIGLWLFLLALILLIAAAILHSVL
uniref:Uncharacterized protein n=1 Tax=Caldilinea aerophila TaxID=133453 RepID=A0A7C1FQE7_9CHLR